MTRLSPEVVALLERALKALEHEPFIRFQWSMKAIEERTAAKVALRTALNPSLSPATDLNTAPRAARKSSSLRGSRTHTTALRLVAGDGIPTSACEGCSSVNPPRIDGECVRCAFGIKTERV